MQINLSLKLKKINNKVIINCQTEIDLTEGGI